MKDPQKAVCPHCHEEMGLLTRDPHPPRYPEHQDPVGVQCRGSYAEVDPNDLIEEAVGWEDVVAAENEKAKLGGQPPTTRASIPPRFRKKDPKRVKAGKVARSSGSRMEREALKDLRALGVKVEKLPVSGRGRARGKGGDYEIEGLGRCEVKGRAGGFRTLYRWLEVMALLLIRAKAVPGGRKPEWLAVIRAEQLGRLIERAQATDSLRLTISCEEGERECCGPEDPREGEVWRSQCFTCQLQYWREKAQGETDDGHRPEDRAGNRQPGEPGRRDAGRAVRPEADRGPGEHLGPEHRPGGGPEDHPGGDVQA